MRGSGFLTQFLHQLDDNGSIPEKMSHSVFGPLPKKVGILIWEEHRAVSAMSQLTKILQKVLGNRLKPKLEAELEDMQYRF